VNMVQICVQGLRFTASEVTTLWRDRNVSNIMKYYVALLLN